MKVLVTVSIFVLFTAYGVAQAGEGDLFKEVPSDSNGCVFRMGFSKEKGIVYCGGKPIGFIKTDSGHSATLSKAVALMRQNNFSVKTCYQSGHSGSISTLFTVCAFDPMTKNKEDCCEEDKKSEPQEKANAKTKDGGAALIGAAMKGHTEIVKDLLAKGADANTKVKSGDTALILAAFDGHTEIVKALLAKGAEVNAKGKDGWTALICAAGGGHTTTVKALLEKGAEVNANDDYGQTALTGAKYRGYTETVELLKQHGAE